MLRVVFVAVASAMLLIAGCGDDDVSTANDQETADQAIAAAEQSLQEDGFGAVPAENDEDLTFKSQECREFDDAFPGDGDLPGETASVDSGDFERGQIGPGGGVQETARALAGFVEEPADLDPVVDVFNDERLGPCLEELFRVGVEEAAAEEGAAVEVGDVEIEQLESEGLGDAGGGVQLAGSLAASGVTVPFSVVFQYARVERALVAVVTSAVGPDQSTLDRTALLRILVDSVSAEGG